VACLTYGARTLWFLGYPQQALRKIQEALHLSETLSHPYSQAFALSGASILHNFRREDDLTLERAEAIMMLCTEQGFPFFNAVATVMRGWALAERRQEDKGIVQICQGITAFRAMGGKFNLSYYLALLTEAYARAGKTERALSILAEARAAVDDNGERLYEAELCRLRGQLTLQLGQLANNSPLMLNHSQSEIVAEYYFRRAIEIAERQSAKCWHLRAMTSLARLLALQGRRQEARAELAKIYDWFTEGFDTADLKDARALLDELSA
jgi:adenylate cyclase